MGEIFPTRYWKYQIDHKERHWPKSQAINCFKQYQPVSIRSISICRNPTNTYMIHDYSYGGTESNKLHANNFFLAHNLLFIIFAGLPSMRLYAKLWEQQSVLLGCCFYKRVHGPQYISSCIEKPSHHLLM